MLREQNQCDPAAASQFLADQLGADEQLAFEEHLESCQRCRDELDVVAAERELWDEVRETLGSGISLRQSSDAASRCDAVLALLKPTDHPNMLGRFGGYEIAGIIGRGGMGVVLKGFDPSLNRFVAIKVLAPHLATSGAARKRFSREAQAAAAVVHDNVIAIHCVSEDDGHPYLVMPYERGRSLRKRLDENGPLDVVEILRIGMQAASGLAAAHAQGLVHRDVKPANILLDEGVERVKLTDFGLARAADDASLTKTGVIAGTPQYMSPEQARGDAIDARSDLFCLGSVMYRMCTGRPPFRAETSYGILRRITDTEPRPIREVNPDVPVWLCEIIARLMAKQPDDRFASAGKVANLLGAWLAHVQQPDVIPAPQRIEQPATSAGGQRSRPRALNVLVGVALAFVLLLAGIVIVLELEKGTLRIECAADNVPVRITQGEKIVETLTVSKSGTSVRVAAGKYVVEIDGEADQISIENGVVELQRRGREVVKIVKRDGKAGAVDSFGSGHEANSVGPTTYDAYLAEVEARRGQQFPEAARMGWRRRWLSRLLDVLEDTNDPELKRSVAASALGLSNALLDFDTSEKLLSNLIQLARDKKEADRWQAELGGIPERRRLHGPDRQRASPTIRSDRDLFQGIWRVVFSEDGGRPNPLDDLRFVFTFAGGRGGVQIWDDGDLEETGNYLIDETKSPKTIDFSGLRGFAHDPKNDPRSLGIYEFPSHDRLRLCLSEKPEDGYPTKFASAPQSVNDSLLELRLVTKDVSALGALSGADSTPEMGAVKQVSEQYLSALLEGRYEDAVMLLVRPHQRRLNDRAWMNETRQLLKGKQVMPWDAAIRGDLALVVSQSLSFGKPLPDIGDSGRLILQLFRTGSEWRVLDVDIWTHQSASEALKKFRQGTETTDSTSEQPATVDSPGQLLSEAIRDFNQRHQHHPIGKDQPPLTDDEVVASIRWALPDAKDQNTPEQVRGLTMVATQRVLPPGWLIEGGPAEFGSDSTDGPQGWQIYLSDKLISTGDVVFPRIAHTVRRRFLTPTPTKVPGKPVENEPNTIPLAAAINGFNQQHSKIDGKRQPLLTEDEVVAAIEYWKQHRNEVPSIDEDFAAFQRIARTRALPQGSSFELLKGFQPGDGARYSIWSVRIRMPKSEGGTYGYTIREQLIGSHRIDTKIAWGPVGEDGIQAGIRFEPRQERYAVGQNLTPYFST